VCFGLGGWREAHTGSHRIDNGYAESAATCSSWST